MIPERIIPAGAVISSLNIDHDHIQVTFLHIKRGEAVIPMGGDRATFILVNHFVQSESNKVAGFMERHLILNPDENLTVIVGTHQAAKDDRSQRNNVARWQISYSGEERKFWITRFGQEEQMCVMQLSEVDQEEPKRKYTLLVNANYTEMNETDISEAEKQRLVEELAYLADALAVGTIDSPIVAVATGERKSFLKHFVEE